MKKLLAIIMLLVVFSGSTVILLPTMPANADTDANDMATAKYLILGGVVAVMAKAMGTNMQYYWGSGCWAAVLGQKFEIYIDPTLPPFNSLGAFTIDDIASISYHTNTPHPITGATSHNFYLVIYTKPDGINDHGWYGYKLIAEPYFSKNLNAPANQWNKWSTDADTNQLTFFDPDTIGFYGFYGQPTLQDIQAGPINWHDYYSGCPVTNIDYGTEVVKYISFQTATGWMNVFQGYIDAITIALKDGTTVSVDLEGFASEVWVNDDWASLPPGYEVEPGKFIGYNAFAKIQDGINAALADGVVHVYPGEYVEQVIISMNLTLEGMTGAKILAPDTRSTFTIPESSEVFDPLIFAYGSLSGTETINVTIQGFEIDGGNKAASSYRYVGILCRNIKPGTIANNVIHGMYPPSGTGKGPQTFGILVYGDSEATIVSNEIREFSRGGIGIMGDAGPGPDPIAVVADNMVYGNGLEPETGWWAENGIQFGYGASGFVINNTVLDCMVNNPSWASSGIIIVDTHNVTIDNNHVKGCDVGICAVDYPSAYGPPWNYDILSNVLITRNVLIGNTWQIDVSNDARNVTITYNNIINATEDGIDIWSYLGDVYPTGVEIHYNNILGSGSYGIWASEELVAAPVDARFNWWGDATGPYHGTSWMYDGRTIGPHYGLGDNVSDYVLYEPWLEYLWPTYPVLKVEPTSYHARLLNEEFSINITINNLSIGWKVVAVEFKLRFNSTLLKVLNVTEGPFLKSFAGPPHQGTYFVYRIKGNYIHVGIVILPDQNGVYHEPYPSGNGTLATITFKVIHQNMGLEKPPESCVLELFETKIADITGNPPGVPHYSENGYFEIPPTVFGDLNYDGTVDIFDLTVAAIAFGSQPGDPNWNPDADLTPDGIIDIFDLVVIALHFGEEIP